MQKTPVAVPSNSGVSPVGLRPDAAGEQSGGAMRCPETRAARDRLRAMAADLASAWRTEGVPAAARSSAGLRAIAETLVKRAQAQREHVGWTMVTIVSEFWRERLAAAAPGRRLLLLPDCPHAAASADGKAVGRSATDADTPLVCGPDCGIATIWSAARDVGWVVEPTRRAVAGIGGLLTGQYDGVLGIARLSDLEKAFAMVPALALPVAAIPYEPSPAVAGQSAVGGCASAMAATAIDVDWVLRLVGVAGGGSAPVGDYLPLLREAAGMFTPPRLASLAEQLGLGPVFGRGDGAEDSIGPLDATAAMAGEYLTRGGKFLRPFISLAAYDAIRSDRGDLDAADGVREAVRAAAVAIEVFHKASLVHDDIEDRDVMRYGRPTLHVERGVPTAINVGDYLIGLGYRIVSGLPGVGPDVLRDSVAILADAHVRLARGQGAELAWRDGCDKALTPAEALAIYGLKTSPAFEAALALGVRLAGVEPRAASAIGPYALHVGTGFQVLNDLKDWNGDLENDRRAAGDLLGGRPTVMWALALEGLSSVEANRLRGLAESAGRPGATDPDVSTALAEARALYAKAGVFERAATIVAEQRALAAAAAAACGGRRLREVLEFLLDLAVPEPATPRVDP